MIFKAAECRRASGEIWRWQKQGDAIRLLLNRPLYQRITWPQFNAWRHLDVVKTTWSSIIRIERKRDFSDVGSGMVVGVRRAGPSISKTLLAFSSSKGKVGVRPATSEVNLKYLKWSVYAFLKSFRIKFSHDEKKKAWIPTTHMAEYVSRLQYTKDVFLGIYSISFRFVFCLI